MGPRQSESSAAATGNLRRWADVVRTKRIVSILRCGPRVSGEGDAVFVENRNLLCSTTCLHYLADHFDEPTEQSAATLGHDKPEKTFEEPRRSVTRHV